MQKWEKLDTDTNSCIHPDAWLEHFNALLNEGEAAPTKLIDELEALEKQPAFSELDFRIKTHEIKKALGRLNKNASPGVDQISGRLLFVGKNELMTAFNLFYNKLFSHATQPEMLTFNFLKPIFKKGESEDPELAALSVKFLVSLY